MATKTKNLKYYEGVGRRKEAVARVRLYITGKDKILSLNANKIKVGEMYLNQKPIDLIFGKPQDKAKLSNPLKLTNNEERFAISILTSGGGRNGQLEAIVHGLARALEKVDKEANRPTLKKNHLLTRDDRTRERRKVGTGGKARRQKQSPKR